ncbi:OmpA family protein [Flavobacterium sp.]|uniref:OmpA family protein n=1 Tax=Flavobacterium sp. TaxID=239 RepID=UPI00286D03CC|nr:OmpA family protein [Flavobacterium sp.]
MKKLILITICLAFALSVKAQTKDKKWNVGLHGGIIQYNGDLGRDFYKNDKTMYGFAGLSVSTYLNSHLDVTALYTRGTLGFDSGTTGYKSDFSSASANLRFNFFNSEFVVRPYLSGGIGVILFDNQLNFHKDLIDTAFPTAGAGVNIRLTPSIMLNLQETFLYTNNDERDGIVVGKKDDYLMHMVGITYNLGSKKDADLDGIADNKDKCPDTPTGVAVDKMGCPLDKDNDGVADYLDTCPDVAGSKMLNGCPDKDADGVADAQDRCPDVAGTTALMGCPDTDGDGVADIDDKCANTKKGSKVDAKGCVTDSDGDGIADDVDRCPTAAGIASLNGCPDTDGDGVPDQDDRCPNTKGNIANKGCPEITKQDAVKITYIGSKIFFENNSDKLKVASLSQLDELSKILNRYEGANLVIEGHTDSNGSDASNITLSQKRTESVKRYLVGKGIAESRLTGIGKGEAEPVANNKTPIGRAKNRRVELKTNY